MRVPASLIPLLDQGTIDEVLRPLQSGKEAQVYLVRSMGEVRIAKVYKEASNRSFKNRSDYVEGRKVRNTRSARAMGKRSRFGKKEEEQSWRATEVDMIYRLREADVVVPEPYDFIDGVLIMQLVTDHNGEPAPRLVDVTLDEDEAWDVFHFLLREVVKMLCAGIVHGDLSDFNVLMGEFSPVIIDFPQAVDPAHNRNARKLLVRDVSNLTSFLAKYATGLRGTRYGEEMWDMYERNVLRPDSKLTGRFKGSTRKADTSSLLDEIIAMEREDAAKREALGLAPRKKRKVSSVGPTPRPIGAKPFSPKRPADDSARRKERPNKRRPDSAATAHQSKDRWGSPPRQSSEQRS
ncbi:MAG: hypothetical protein GWP91_25600, partial [Rhodobacterales bacterium]|nr:hypothetical protein [Rhodobacterales bacterium]